MLATTKTRRIAPKDYELTTVQTNVANQVDAIAQIPFNNGNWIQGVSVTVNVAVAIPHGLGQPWQGYWITRAQDSGVTLRDATPTDITPFPDTSIYLTVVPGATAVIDLAVF